MVKRSDIKTSWSSIPTQTQADNPSLYHQPYAFDNRQKFNGKAGRGGVFIDKTETREKVRSGNQVIGGKKIKDVNGYNFFPGWSPVYENPLDRVYRDGKWQEITALNAETWRKKKAPKDSGKKNRQSKKSPVQNTAQAVVSEALPPRKKVLHAMRVKD